METGCGCAAPPFLFADDSNIPTHNRQRLRDLRAEIGMGWPQPPHWRGGKYDVRRIQRATARREIILGTYDAAGNEGIQSEIAKYAAEDACVREKGPAYAYMRPIYVGWSRKCITALLPWR